MEEDVHKIELTDLEMRILAISFLTMVHRLAHKEDLARLGETLMLLEGKTDVKQFYKALRSIGDKIAHPCQKDATAKLLGDKYC